MRTIGDDKEEAEAAALYMAQWVARLQNENTRLRAVLSKCAIALGNGASIPIDAPIEDLEIFPLEIHAVVRRLSEKGKSHDPS